MKKITSVKKTQTCDYKFMSAGGAIPKITRFYERLTGKKMPPIDSWYFYGSKPRTTTKPFIYQHLSKNETWVNGKLSGVKYHFDDKVVSIPIIVQNYASDQSRNQRDSAHAIAAFKYKNTLFCFNSHGMQGLYLDKQIFNQIAKQYNCKNVLIYNGKNFQDGDPYGVCAGYAMNFILEMLILAADDKIPNKLTQSQYVDFISRAITKRGILFGGTFNTQVKPFNKIEYNLMKPIVTPDENFKLKRSNVENLSFKRKALLNRLIGRNNYVIQTPMINSPKYDANANLNYFSSGNRNRVVAAKTLKDLKNVARKRKIKGFSTYKKSEMENLRRKIISNINKE